MNAGAFGTVYEITDKKTGEHLAVKQISKAKMASDEDVADVRREMQVLLLAPGPPLLPSRCRARHGCAIWKAARLRDWSLHGRQVLELVGDHENIAALKGTFEDKDFVRPHCCCSN